MRVERVEREGESVAFGVAAERQASKVSIRKSSSRDEVE